MEPNRYTAALLRAVLIVSIALLYARSPALAQSMTARDGYRSETIQLAGSPPSGATYRLEVLLPPGHDTTTVGLPVLYYLDAWWWGDLLESLTRMAATSSPPRTSPVILVGVSVVGDVDEFNRSRNMDFTPSRYRPIAPGVTMKTGNVVLDSAGTGGASGFLDFLEHEVIPEVDGRYNTRAHDRGIAGHSYGGLFATWLLATRPGLFNRYLIVSPATYWNDSEVLARGSFVTGPSAAGLRVYLAVGSREMAIMTRSADELKAALDSAGHTELVHRVYEGADHLTVLPGALLDGLVHLYSPPGHHEHP